MIELEQHITSYTHILSIAILMLPQPVKMFLKNLIMFPQFYRPCLMYYISASSVRRCSHHILYIIFFPFDSICSTSVL